MIDLQKLRHEWKTFFLSISTFAVGVWEAARADGYDLTPLIPEKYKPFAIPGVGLAFLLLRQWKNANVADK